MVKALEIDTAKLMRLIVDNTGERGGTKRFTRRGLSLCASEGKNPDLIRDFMRSNSKAPAYESVAGICRALGVPLSAVVKGVEPRVLGLKEWLTVSGTVVAGVWREQSEWSHDEWFQVEVDTVEGGEGHQGLVVEGRSMDRSLPPGTILRCIPLIGSGLTFEDGDYVIVEKLQAALRETTCKRLALRPDGNWELRAESTLPEFRDPIFIGKPIDRPDGPGFDGVTDDEIRVRAVVIDAYLPLARRKRRPLPDEA